MPTPIASARRCPAICAAAPATSRSSRRCSKRAPPIGRPTSHDRDEPLHRQPGRADRGSALSARPRPIRRRSEARRACCMPRSCAAPIAHGRVAAIDASGALAIPGVRAVITAKDIGAVPRIPLRLLPLPGTERFLQPVIAADRVRYVGEPVAVVLADSAALAEDGVGAIAPRYRRAAAGPGSARFRARRHPVVRGDRHQPRDDLHRGQGRRRCGVSRGALRQARAVRERSAIPHCRWSRAASSPNGMRRRGG